MCTNCVLYLRVSTKEQGSKHSLDAQQETLYRYADDNDMNVVKTYVDQSSGLDMDRGSLIDLLDEAKNGLFDRVLVTERDRLSRNPDHMAVIRWELGKCDVDIVTTEQQMDDKSDFEVFTDKLLNLVSWWEVKQFQIRAKRGRKKAEKKGVRCNRPPLLEKEPEKYFAILGLYGFASLRGIARIVDMSAAGVKYIIDNYGV